MGFMSYLFHLVRRKIKIKEIDKKKKEGKGQEKIKERKKTNDRKKEIMQMERNTRQTERKGKWPKERKKNEQIKWRMKE